MADDQNERTTLARLWGGKKPGSETEALANLRETRSEVAPTTLKAREDRTEMLTGPQPDGRRLRATGRTEQLNLKVRPEFKTMLEKLARECKAPMVEVVEWCVEQYASDFKGRTKR